MIKQVGERTKETRKLVEIKQSNMRVDMDRSFWKLSDIENDEI